MFAITFGTALLTLAIAFGATPAAQAPPINLTGTWTGTGHDTYVGGQPDTIKVTWVLTQTGSTVSGTVQTLPLSETDGSCSSCHRLKTGTFSGTVSGTALTLTMDFPKHSGGPTPECAVTITGFAATIANNSFTTTYSGTDSCEVPILNGTLDMTLQATPSPAITTQPASQTVASGANAAFTVAASGVPAPAYQWQVSVNGGGSFTDLSDAPPYSGVTTATLTITAASAGLSGYQYRAVATNSAGSATSSAATLTVTVPTMSIDKSSLTFGAVTTGAAFTLEDRHADGAPDPDRRRHRSTWTAASTAPWLVVSPTSGSGSATLTISVAVRGRPRRDADRQRHADVHRRGQYGGSDRRDAEHRSSTAAAAPTGSFDTPADGIDRRDRIDRRHRLGDGRHRGHARADPARSGRRRSPPARSCSSATPCSSTARVPTCRRSSRTLPRNSRAGWGYLMLTNFLPGLGNGTFRLHGDRRRRRRAFDDRSGTKTITCTNSARDHAVRRDRHAGAGRHGQRPNVTNFGWVLSRGRRAARIRRAAAPCGSSIDGAFISAVARRLDEPVGSDGALSGRAVPGDRQRARRGRRSTPRR